MNKLYDRIIWYNNTTPALNQSNLNDMSKAIDDIDDRVIELAAEILLAAVHAQEAKESAEDSEAWAQGTRNGVNVSSDDPTYQHNSKWYSEHLQTNIGNLNDVEITDPEDGEALIYNSATNKWKNGTADVGLFVKDGILTCRYETE